MWNAINDEEFLDVKLPRSNEDESCNLSPTFVHRLSSTLIQSHQLSLTLNWFKFDES